MHSPYLHSVKATERRNTIEELDTTDAPNGYCFPQILHYYVDQLAHSGSTADIMRLLKVEELTWSWFYSQGVISANLNCSKLDANDVL
jgi:hypothetical protein